MTAKKEYLKNGQVHISTEVLSIITSIAAREIEGVQDASSGFVDEISSLFNKKNNTKGIKIEVKENNVYIDISINVEYGYNVHKVAEAVQARVSEKIENMTELNVTSVNVNVANVFIKEEEEVKTEEKDSKEEVVEENQQDKTEEKDIEEAEETKE
ncbi:MAG: Asp23/Gls24 family envelope stress response protein [Bacillota bacterium]|nr:Asp23/Gls24 family envelope stress response protein [Bacillota bacterium]